MQRGETGQGAKSHSISRDPQGSEDARAEEWVSWQLPDPAYYR